MVQRGVEDLVPAVLGVGLREHHQFDVGRVAAEFAVALAQVVDLVLGQRQAEARVGRFQLAPAGCAPARRAPASRTAPRRRRASASSDCVIGSCSSLATARLRRGIGRPAGEVDAQCRARRASPAGRRRAAVRWPCSPTARSCPGAAATKRETAPSAARLAASAGLAGCGCRAAAIRRGARLGLDPVGDQAPVMRSVGNEGLQAGFEPFAAERRQGRQALEDDHVRRNRGNGPAIVTEPARAPAPRASAGRSRAGPAAPGPPVGGAAPRAAPPRRRACRARRAAASGGR